MDDDTRYRALDAKDARFDGMFFVGVTSTGIYCRPSCPAKTPKRANVRFHRTAASAQQAGFRACKRCRPDAAPGSPEWNVRSDLVGRAMRLIGDGVVDREGVPGLAHRLGYSSRHLTRQLRDELGAGPLALARAQRAQTARILLERSDLPVSAVAFAAGFASVRQCNDTMQAVFAMTPTALRAAAGRRGRAEAVAARGVLSLRLAFRAPLHADHVLGFIGRRGVTGMEEGDGSFYRRSLSMPHGDGVMELSSAHVDQRYILCRLHLQDMRDVPTAVQRARRLLDLDADAPAIDSALGRDPLLGPLVRRRPGLRAPGCVDGAELAVRVVLGQQVSVEAARTLASKLTMQHGKPLAAALGEVTHLFPTPDAIAEAPDADLPMPSARRRALRGMCAALADGSLVLDPGVDRDQVSAQLLAMPGIGPWTVAAIRQRVLGDPDSFLVSDLGVRDALRRLGVAGDPRSAATVSQGWAPWRSYALHHLWAELSAGAAPTTSASNARAATA